MKILRVEKIGFPNTPILQYSNMIELGTMNPEPRKGGLYERE